MLNSRNFQKTKFYKIGIYLFLSIIKKLTNKIYVALFCESNKKKRIYDIGNYYLRKYHDG